MGIYKNAGNLMIIYAAFNLATIAVNIFNQILTGNLLTQQDPTNLIKTLQQTYYTAIALTAISLTLLALLTYYLYQIGQENTITTIWIGPILLIIGVGIGLAIMLIYLPELINIYQQITQGNITQQQITEIIRIMGIISIGAIIPLIGYIILGLGIRNLGKNYGNTTLNTGGLLIILAFIPLLAPIGLILTGTELRKIE